MTAYVAILEKEPGTLWGVWFPDLPGCIAAAETSEAVIAQASEALHQWLTVHREDGQTVPAPRTIEALRADREFGQALAAGHAALVVRTPADELGLDDAQMQAVEDAAARSGISRQVLVRELVLNRIAG